MEPNVHIANLVQLREIRQRIMYNRMTYEKQDDATIYKFDGRPYLKTWLDVVNSEHVWMVEEL